LIDHRYIRECISNRFGLCVCVRVLCVRMTHIFNIHPSPALYPTP